MTPVIDGMKFVARHRTLRALILVLALIAAACSSSADTVSAEAADSADDTVAEAAPAADADADNSMADDTADATDGAMADGESAATDDPPDSDETPAPVSGPPPALPPEEAQAAAEQNIPNLQTSDDVRDIEVVSVYDGSVTSLRGAVAGDRPVLVWFWAPH